MEITNSFLGPHCSRCGGLAEPRGGECAEPNCDCHDADYVHEESGLEDCPEGGDANEENTQ